MEDKKTLDIEKFDPTVAELNALVEKTKQIVITDFNDKAQLEEVKKNRIELKTARVNITKHGKELREDALSFQRAVLAKEKELIAIIEPEEKRLKEIEDEAKVQKEKADRLKNLPFRKEKLVGIEDGIEITDEEILEMNGLEFEVYCNKRISDKNEKDRLEIEAEKKRLEEEKIEKEKMELVRQQECERIRQENKEKAEKIEREKQELILKQKTDFLESRGFEIIKNESGNILKAQKELYTIAGLTIINLSESELYIEVDRIDNLIKEDQKKLEIERERKEKERLEAEKERIENDKQYKKFLLHYGCTPETKDKFTAKRVGNKIKLYELVGEFELKTEF